jgi:hypothetical protein
MTNVLPCHTSNRFRNNGLGYVKSSRHLVHVGNSKSILFSDLNNNGIGKLRVIAINSRVNPVATLVKHVLSVLLVGSKKQMERITAHSIVALVTHKKSIRNFHPGDRPRKSVCQPQFGSALKISILCGHRLPVGASIPSKWPAAFRSCYKNMRPEIGPCVRLNRVASEGSLWLHNQFLWLCHALGCSFTARALSF